MTRTIQLLQWYWRKHGLVPLFRIAFRKAVDRWLIRSEYLFVINLDDDSIDPFQRFDPIDVQCYSSLESIASSELRQLSNLKGRVVALPFLERYFARGARLWLAKYDDKVIGLEWTVTGGFSGFYSIPLPQTDVILIAVEIFQEFRGQKFWQRFTAGLLLRLRAEGASRVYFKVHCRNYSMLRAVRKAGIPMIGRVITLSIKGYYLTIWDKRFLGNHRAGYSIVS